MILVPLTVSEETTGGGRMHIRTKIAFLAIGMVAAMVMVEGAALAHSFNEPSSVSIGYSNGAFRGGVRSGRAFCRANRTVTVYKVRSGPDFPVGSDRTNNAGYYTVRARANNGRFYAVVSSKRENRYGHSHRCGGDSSGTIRRRNGRTTVAGSGIGRDDQEGGGVAAERAATAAGAAEGESAGLPFTGEDALPYVAGGLGLVAMGSLALAYRRRRRTSVHV